jgi:hypothetical protein
MVYMNFSGASAAKLAGLTAPFAEDGASRSKAKNCTLGERSFPCGRPKKPGRQTRFFDVKRSNQQRMMLLE